LRWNAYSESQFKNFEKITQNMKTQKYFKLFFISIIIFTSINAIAWPIDSVYWNKSVTPHTLYLKLTKGYATRHLWGQVNFNLTNDTLIAEYHFLQCFGPTAVLPWDTTFILTSSVDTPLYHLAVREYFDSSTVIPGCYDTLPAMGELYIGYSGTVGLSIYEQLHLLSLFPNPVSSLLYLNPQNGVEIYNLRLFNSLGQSLHIRPSDDFKIIDMANVPKGFYILRIETSKGILLRKVQKE
jgi:hypothetical protein